MPRFGLVLVCMLIFGCPGSGKKSPGFNIETILDSDHVIIGGKVGVTCLIKDKTGNPVTFDTSIKVLPNEGVEIDGLSLVPAKTGEYKVACVVPKYKIEDKTPAILYVMEPTKTIAILDKEKVSAGNSANVTCIAQSADGQKLSRATFIIDQVENLIINNLDVTSTKAGQYLVSCSIVGYSGSYEKQPAILTVVAGDPEKIEITADPELDPYNLLDTVRLGIRAFDKYGNQNIEVQGHIIPPTTDGIEAKGDNQFTFKKEGAYSFKAVLEKPWDDIQTQRTLVCDSSPPIITIFFPDRGATFEGNPEITVKGKVEDLGSEVIGVSINGNTIKLSENGTFQYQVMSEHGINPLVVIAQDKYQHTSKVTRGWYYSTGWKKMPEDVKIDEAKVQEGVMTFLTQSVIDDGQHDPAKLDDLATIIEVLLGQMDYSALIASLGGIPPINIPNIINWKIPIIDAGLEGDLEVQVKVKEVKFGSPKVSLQCRDGGIDSTVSLSPFSLGLELTFIMHAKAVAKDIFGNKVEAPLLDPKTTTVNHLTIGVLSIFTSLDIAKTPGKDITVKGKDFQLKMEKIDIDPITSLVIDLGEVNLLGKKVNLGSYDLSQIVGSINDLLSKYVINPIVNFITQPLIDLVEPLVTTIMGDAIKQFISMFAINQKFTIPPVLGGESLDVTLGSDLSSVIFNKEGARIGINIGLLTTKKVDREPIGVILRDGCNKKDIEPLLFTFKPSPEAQMGFKNDFANEALFAVWWSGFLNQTIDASNLIGGNSPIPIEDLTITPTFYLPPILDDCNSKGLQMIEVGDLYLDLTFTLGSEQHLGIYLQLKAVGGIIAKGNQIGLKIDKVQTFEAEILDIGGNLGPLADMIPSLIPLLLNQMEGKEFSFPVPPFDLSSAIPQLPKGTTLKLDNLTSYKDKGVVVVGGDLE